MTRQNSIPSEDGNSFVNALIPLWDMCNHMNGNVSSKKKSKFSLLSSYILPVFQISTDYNPSLQRSECLAVKDFKAGEQLFIFYGIRNNADLFIHNG